MATMACFYMNLADRPFTTRRIQQIVQGYREKAGLTQPVHPHLFRHQMLTYLTAKGLTDAQIQLISGHESKKSLEVYQHLSLESVDKAYQHAVQTVGICCGARSIQQFLWDITYLCWNLTKQIAVRPFNCYRKSSLQGGRC